ncbi:hypothetical protein ACFQX6_07010 [Streptosporangium lutulentum]
MSEWLDAEDFPEHRRAALLRCYAWLAQSEDLMVVAALVAARAAEPCRMMKSRTSEPRPACSSYDSANLACRHGRTTC